MRSPAGQTRRPTRGKILFLLILALSGFLIGCAAFPTPAAAPTPAPLSPTPTVTPTAYRGLCAYVWVEQQLPEISAQLNQFFRRADLGQVDASVAAYGETCVDSGANVVVRFTPQEVSYSLTLQVEDVTDTRALGDWLTRMIVVLGDFQSTGAAMAESKAGRVEVLFQDASRLEIIAFPLLHGQELVNQGVKGAGLFEQLSK